MERNVSKWDRILRVVIGVGLLALMFIGPKTVLELFGIIPLATGIAGHCPIYSLFGISTCPRAKPVRGKRERRSPDAAALAAAASVTSAGRPGAEDPR